MFLTHTLLNMKFADAISKETMLASSTTCHPTASPPISTSVFVQTALLQSSARKPCRERRRRRRRRSPELCHYRATTWWAVTGWLIKKKSDQTITTAIIDKQSDYVKTPHEISAKRMRRPEPSLETNALIECVDSEQTYYFSSSVPCTTAPPLRKALTGNEEARQHYHTTTPYPISFGHPGFPSCLLDAAGTLCPPVYNLPVDGYHDNFKHLVEAADKKSYKETVGIMNFTSSSSSPLLSSTGSDERGARPSPPSNGQQPIFNVNNMMLFESLLGASDNIQALVSANDTPSSKDARMLVDIPGLIDSFKTTLQGKSTDAKKSRCCKLFLWNLTAVAFRNKTKVKMIGASGALPR